MAGRKPVIAGVLVTGYHDALQAGREFATVGVDRTPDTCALH